MTVLPAATPPLSSMPEPSTTRWRPLRAGLQNLWQFDHTTRFVFHRGRLLLRGRNGAGKTKVVELLLPFLLEGRLDPRRLDPFGSRSRKMHYNLLHEGNRKHESSSGYAWIEFGRMGDDGPEYLTIGAGLKARRSNDKVTSWFFVLRGRRIDEDFDLLESDRRPRTAVSLTEAVGEDGAVFTSARDYRAAVNRELFGLDTQQYESLVEALLRLRQPHLSERLDPAEVGVVLSDSLPPLDSERVREVAEGFERIETHRRELDERRGTLTALGGFLGEYRTYVGAVAVVRAADVVRADRSVRATRRESRAAEKFLADAEALQSEHAEQSEVVDRKREAAGTRIRTIQGSDAYRAVQQLQEAKEHADTAQGRSERMAERHSDAQARVGEAESRQARCLTRRTDQEVLVERESRRARREAAAADLGDAHAALHAQLNSEDGAGGVAAGRGLVQAIASAREGAIERVRAEVGEVARAERETEREAERLADSTEALRSSRGAAERAEAEHEVACGTHSASCEQWVDALTILALDAEARTALLDAPPAEVEPLVRAHAEPVRVRLDERTAEAELALGSLEEQQAKVRARRDDLKSTTHEPPASAPWRTSPRAGRAGAPLYMLLEFNAILPTGQQACVEAALEAAGLLDAWVTPAGEILNGETLDAFVLPVAPCAGRTLADVTTPTPSGGVPRAVVSAIAESIAVVEAEARSADGPHAWVAPDGRFGLGPLRGRSLRKQVAYIGEAARAAERARRLVALERDLASLERECTTAHATLTQRRAERGRLEEEIARLPSPADTLRTQALLEAAVTRQGEAERVHVERAAAHAEALEVHERARRQRDAVAEDVGLGLHLDDLDALARATTAWQMACGDWIHAVEVLVERSDALRAAEEDLAETLARAEDAARERASADGELAAFAERVRTLKDVVGASEEVLEAELDSAIAQERELRSEGARLSRCRIEDAHAVGAREQAVEAARAGLERAVTACDQAITAFAHLGRLGVLALVAGGAPAPEEAHSEEAHSEEAMHGEADLEGEEAVTRARAVVEAGPEVPRDPDAVLDMLESAQNTVARRLQELRRSLVAGVRLSGRMAHGVLLHDAQYMGKGYSLPGLVGELRDDVAEREHRLALDEQDLLEEFLRGELHEHVRSRIREAAALVERMNTLLSDCPTATGQRLRLVWKVGEDAPPGTEEAVGLLMRGAAMLTDARREHLRTWLHERLREAREGDGAASLRERIAKALDYRQWHRFFVEFTTGSGWRRLTRKTHGTGSGGEKAVMLHLPLFAAMAAHYEGRPNAPRLIVLDEVFAGIDRGTRGQLMHLLVNLDLDAVLTSHEEWGFYAELDGISTYHLIRDPELPGVLPQWFVWDGHTRFAMPENA